MKRKPACATGKGLSGSRLDGVAVSNDKRFRFTGNVGGWCDREDVRDAKQVGHNLLFKRLVTGNRNALLVIEATTFKVSEKGKQREGSEIRLGVIPGATEDDSVVESFPNHGTFTEKLLQAACWHRLLPRNLGS